MFIFHNSTKFRSKLGEFHDTEPSSLQKDLRVGLIDLFVLTLNSSSTYCMSRSLDPFHIRAYYILGQLLVVNYINNCFECIFPYLTLIDLFVKGCGSRPLQRSCVLPTNKIPMRNRSALNRVKDPVGFLITIRIQPKHPDPQHCV